MINLTLSEFLKDPETYLKNAAGLDDFFTVQTSGGKAVVISESEWSTLLEIFKYAIHNK